MYLGSSRDDQLLSQEWLRGVHLLDGYVQGLRPRKAQHHVQEDLKCWSFSDICENSDIYLQ